MPALRRTAQLSCLLSLLIPLTLAAEESGSWPQWRGPSRDGHAADTGLDLDWEARPPKLAWRSEGVGSGYAGFSVVGNRMYTTGNFPDGQAVLALDAADGSIVWKKNVTDSAPKHGFRGSRSTPTVDGDHLYVVASSGAIVCLDRADGNVVWKRSFQKDWGGQMMSVWGFSESPLVDGDRVICTPGGSEGMLVALNKATGEEIWKSRAPESRGRGKDGAGYSSVAISTAAGVRQYVTLVGRGAIGVRASDGELLWTYNRVANGTANIPTPVCFGDYVFCATGYRTGAALCKLERDGDGVKATEQYFLDARTLQNHHGGMVRFGDYIYCGHGHNDGKPICVEVSTGEVKWGGRELRGAGSGSAAVVAVDGHLIFRYESGQLALIEATPESYQLKGVLKPAYQKGKSWAHPAVCNGRMYLREQNVVMCYELK